MRDMSPGAQEALAKVLSRTIQARALRDGRPYIVAHLITGHCNCKCASCLWRHNDWVDVSTEGLKKFYREAKEEGFVALAISGGAPFLRKDLGELVKYVKHDLGMAILVFNTGWFLKKRMDEIVPHVDAMIVSLDSADPAKHDEIRGLPGLFDRLVDGIQTVKQKYPKFSIQFNTCVQQGMTHEIDDMIDLTEDLGIRISFDVITEARHGADGTSFTETAMGLPMPELQEVCAEILERKKEGAPIVNSEGYFQYFVDGRKGYKCHLPKVCMFVDSRGYVENCLNLDDPLGNFTETPLKEIMASARFKQLRADAENCWSCNSPTMVDVSHIWEDPTRYLGKKGGLELS